MARRIKVKLNQREWRGFRTDARSQAVTDELAAGIAARFDASTPSGAEASWEQNPSSERARSSVKTATVKAVLAEARHGSMTKAMTGG